MTSLLSVGQRVLLDVLDMTASGGGGRGERGGGRGGQPEGKQKRRKSGYMRRKGRPRGQAGRRRCVEWPWWVSRTRTTPTTTAAVRSAPLCRLSEPEPRQPPAAHWRFSPSPPPALRAATTSPTSGYYSPTRTFPLLATSVCSCKAGLQNNHPT